MNQRLWGPTAVWWIAPAILAGAPPGLLATGLTLACIVRYGGSRHGLFPSPAGRAI